MQVHVFPEEHNTERTPMNYLVRIIPPDKKSDAKTFEWHDVHEVFRSPTALRIKLIESFRDKIPSTTCFQIGYIAKRGNGKRWIEDSPDLRSMYKQLELCDTITLFCEGRADDSTSSGANKRKRKAPAEQSPDSGRLDHEEEVKRVAVDLSAKHGTKYNEKQFKLWARMIVNKQHEDLDEPPNIPLLTGGIKKIPRKETLSEAITGAACAFAKALTSREGDKPPLPGTPNGKSSCVPSASAGISPSSKARLSGEYIKQLKTLQELRENGVLSDVEFQEQKTYALDSIRNMNKNK